MKPKKNEHVLVTTEFRGVFFGCVKNAQLLPEEITLANARNCICWSQDIEGFLGLATKGPLIWADRLKITSTTPLWVRCKSGYGYGG